MGILTLILTVVTTVVLAVGLLSALLRLWLKGELQSLTVAVKVLNTTVTHFVEHQKDLGHRVDRLDSFAHDNRERLVKVETKGEAAHIRIDNITNAKGDGN